MPAVSLDFTNGQTRQRFTITDASIRPDDNPLTSVNKRFTTEVNDVGYVYTASVVSCALGTFDVLVVAISDDDNSLVPAELPNEYVTLVYRNNP